MPRPFSRADSLASYRASISRRRQLAPAEERDLARRWRAGDRAAGHALVEANLAFVVGIAREYRRWGVPLEDVVQQGNLGLLKAAARFDPERDCRLVTYAAYWIRAEIREYVVRGYRIVRLGTTKSERRALRAYRTTREEDPAALAAMSGLGVAQAERLLPLLAARDVSLDHAAGAGAAPLLDRIAGPSPTPEDDACERDEREHVRREVAALLRGLTPRERIIVRARWLADEPTTLERVGLRLGVSKERVRQLEERIAARLRERLRTPPPLDEAG